jgi:acyl-coenzyme A thioesterase PaaI-like protein
MLAARGAAEQPDRWTLEMLMATRQGPAHTLTVALTVSYSKALAQGDQTASASPLRMAA